MKNNIIEYIINSVPQQQNFSIHVKVSFPNSRCQFLTEYFWISLFLVADFSYMTEICMEKKMKTQHN